MKRAAPFSKQQSTGSWTCLTGRLVHDARGSIRVVVAVHVGVFDVAPAAVFSTKSAWEGPTAATPATASSTVSLAAVLTAAALNARNSVAASLTSLAVVVAFASCCLGVIRGSGSLVVG